MRQWTSIGAYADLGLTSRPRWAPARDPQGRARAHSRKGGPVNSCFTRPLFSPRLSSPGKHSESEGVADGDFPSLGVSGQANNSYITQHLALPHTHRPLYHTIPQYHTTTNNHLPTNTSYHSSINTQHEVLSYHPRRPCCRRCRSI